MPVYYEMTEAALEVLYAVTSHSVFYATTKYGNYCT